MPSPRISNAGPAPLPIRDEATIPYRVKAGETLTSIAAEFGIGLQELIRLNPQLTDPNKLSVGDEIRVPATYTVKKGETLYAVAKKLGCSVDELVAANKLTNPNRLEVGQKLRMPVAKAQQQDPAPTPPQKKDTYTPPRTAPKEAPTPKAIPAKTETAAKVERSEKTTPNPYAFRVSGKRVFVTTAGEQERYLGYIGEEGGIHLGTPKIRFPISTYFQGETVATLSREDAAIYAVCMNEGGGFDTTNTGSSSDISFGIIQFNGFQADDLGFLLLDYKSQSPEDFKRVFADKGIDVEPKGSNARVTIDGKHSVTELRSYRVAAIFQDAAGVRSFQAAQVRAARSRLQRDSKKQVNDRALSEWFPSKLGHALLMEVSVRAPARMKPFGRKAFENLAKIRKDPAYNDVPDQTILMAGYAKAIANEYGPDRVNALLSTFPGEGDQVRAVYSKL